MQTETIYWNHVAISAANLIWEGIYKHWTGLGFYFISYINFLVQGGVILLKTNDFLL